VSIQTFSNSGKRIETRFLVRHPNGTYGAYTYEWDTAQTQATLVPPDGKKRSDWEFLPRTSCFSCHSSAANTNLGLETQQINIDSLYPTTGRTANQLLTLNSVGMLSGNTAATTPLPAISDTPTKPELPSLAYLHVNCSGCHQPSGGGSGPMDFRFSTKFADKKLCNQASGSNTMGLPSPAVLLKPGAHLSSVAWLRLNARGVSGAMPRVGTKLVDTAGAAVLAKWIDELTTCP
jgi:mono/diheme cytochrome c family protein